MKDTLLTLTILATFSCATAPDTDDHFKVDYKGALKNIMHKGDLSAQADLTDFQDTEHFYALGAVENLKGEVLILDSKPFISSVQKYSECTERFLAVSAQLNPAWLPSLPT